MTGPRRGRDEAPAGPFAALGLPAVAGLTDDEVRAAWRRIAAATHPDRPDGGDQARFAAASAAYTILRTRSGRGEALADLAGAGRPGGSARPARRASAAPVMSPPRDAPAAREFAPAAVAHAGPVAAGPAGLLATGMARIRRGRPSVLAVRLLIVIAAGAAPAALVGWSPATPALITGALTWFVLTARHDLAPPR